MISLSLSEGKLAAHRRDLGRLQSLFGNVCFSAECGGEASSKRCFTREREREGERVHIKQSHEVSLMSQLFLR